VAADQESRLLRLAEAVSDRQPVPWSDERAAAGELRGVVEGLESLHALAGAFADIEPPGTGGDGAPIRGRWGQLELVARLGEGSFGEVFRARDPNLGREVALKLRRAGPGTAGESGRRLLEEARRLARIRHRNVVTVHGADLYDGRVGIWTELIEGQTLEERLEVDGPVGAGEAIALGLDLCRALAAVHASGLVHGDVKTANVLRERGGRIVLTDLGSSTETGEPALTGSPATLAPEVLEGAPATPVADLFSLGMLLFRMLSGSYPAHADGAAHPVGRRASLRDLRPDLPLDLVQVVERAANPDPERRYPSAGALEQALASLGGGAAAPSTAEAQPIARRGAVVLAALAAAVLVATTAVLVTRATQKPVEVALPAAERPLAAETAASEPEAVPAAEPASVPAAPAPVAALPTPLVAQATIFRAREADEGEPLADGARIRPGDRLYLELAADEPVHAWVINEDLDGKVFVLFPIAGLDLGNPLPGGCLHRLPGRLGGQPQHWQVTSAGGRELFVVIAAREPQPSIERELAAMVAAEPTEGALSRGVGALGPAPAAGRGRLDALLERLEAARRRDGSVWFERLELANP
jgi:hypothetical protein